MKLITCITAGFSDRQTYVHKDMLLQTGNDISAVFGAKKVKKKQVQFSCVYKYKPLPPPPPPPPRDKIVLR